MSTPFNKLTFEEPAEGAPPLPPPTYESLANFVRVKPGSIGRVGHLINWKLVGRRR